MTAEMDLRVVGNPEQLRYELWLGERLVAGTLDGIRARCLKLVPFCPFVDAYLRRHLEDANLVVREPAGRE